MKTNSLVSGISPMKGSTRIDLDNRQRLPIGEGTMRTLSSVLASDHVARKSYLENPLQYLRHHGVALEGGTIVAAHMGATSNTVVCDDAGVCIAVVAVAVIAAAYTYVYVSSNTSGSRYEQSLTERAPLSDWV